MDTLTQAIGEWRALLGAAHVTTNTADVQATFATEQRVLARIEPDTVEAVQACVRIAAELNLCLYPVSRGENWGLGSAVPPVDAAVLLDLHRLDRILDYNERFATLTVEPGVTFEQAAHFLQQRHSPHFLPVTGGPPTGSVLGNTLERGHGVGRQARRHRFIIAMTVILADGSRLQTGMSQYPDTSTSGLYADAPGPDLTGLFLQSRLGAVVSMTLFLEPRSPIVYAFQASVEDRALPHVIDQLQPLMLRGVLPECGCTLWNGYKLHALEQRQVDRNAGMTMFLSGAMYHETEAQAQATQAILRQALQPLLPDLTFNQVTGPSLLTGTPTTRHLKGVKNQGVIWLCPVTPFDGKTVVHLLEVTESIIAGAGFQPQIGIECGTGRTLEWFIAIVYDRTIPGADEAALACHRQLTGILHNMGHLPYRLGILDSQRYIKDNPALQRLYDTFDPRRLFV